MTSFILFAPSTVKEFVHPGLEADSQRDFLKDIVCCWLHFKGYWRWLTATRFLIRRSQPTSKWYSYCSTQASRWNPQNFSITFSRSKRYWNFDQRY